jgi:phage repressor protein C with HTH and peptisase S24 domain
MTVHDLKVKGDSMEPTLLSGDLVLVNRERTAVELGEGIYAVALGADILVKRV